MVKSMRNTEAASIGGAPRIKAGAYACKIEGVLNDELKETAVGTMTVAEGPSAGAQFRVWFNYRDERDSKRTRQKLDAVSASNPGFDAVAAWDAEQWKLFAGRAVGVVFNEIEKVKNGRTYVNVDAGAVVPLQSLRDGSAPEPQRRTADGRYISLGEARAAEQSTEQVAMAVAAYDWQDTGAGGGAYQQPTTQYAPGGYMAQQAAQIPPSAIPF